MATTALVVVEILGCLAMWAPIPLVWMWVGARVYDATGSMSADLAVALGGFFVSTVATMRALMLVDSIWVDLRQRAGLDQRSGALTQVVVISSTIAIVLFWIWFHLVEEAFIIPFMPNR